MPLPFIPCNMETLCETGNDAGLGTRLTQSGWQSFLGTGKQVQIRKSYGQNVLISLEHCYFFMSSLLKSSLDILVSLLSSPFCPPSPCSFSPSLLPSCFLATARGSKVIWVLLLRALGTKCVCMYGCVCGCGCGVDG